MEMEEITLLLRERARTLAARLAATQWYLFGSVTRGVALPGDVDLLIVYTVLSDASELRVALEEFGALIPLHVLLLTPDEEEQLQFVREQHAVRIFP